MNQKTEEFLRGNLVTGEKTTEASLSSNIYFARFNPSWGNNPLQFTLQENTDSVYTIDFPAPTGRGSNPCKPTM